MLLSLLATVILVSPGPLDFFADGPYDPVVPRPETLLHYGPGERITTYRDQERVLMAIAEKAKTRVKAIEYGESVERRPLRVFAISTPENIARLDEIRKDHEAIANGQADDAMVKRSVPIVWINECIHGNEPASFESAMYLIYNLAASRSRSLTRALENVIVMVNPVYNPDGHERFAVYYGSVATGSSDPDAYENGEPSAIYGRLNHYRFDMNRDRVAMSQQETKQEVAEFLRWNPQVYVDQHGQVESYFFPPNPMSVNANVDRERLNHWTEIFGRATGRAFDRQGFSYFVKDEFDLYYPGYLDSFTCLAGAIGMTHETDGGKELSRTRSDGSTLTLRDGVEKHFTSAIAVVLASADHRGDLMAGYAAFKRKVVSGEAAGKFKRVVLVSADPRPLQRLQTQLGYAGVRSSWNPAPFKQPDANNYWSSKRESVTFPSNSLVVDMAQPQGRYAKAVLEPGSDFEPEFVKAQQNKKKTAPEGEKYPGPDGGEFYDMTGWALPYAHNLQAWWCESAPKVELSPTPLLSSERPRQVELSTVGYALEYTDISDILAAYDALLADLHGSVTVKPMTLAGHRFERGTFLFLCSHNEDDLRDKLSDIARRRHVALVPLTTSYPDEDRQGPGSESVQPLRKPSIAVVFGHAGELSQVGGAWYLLDQKFRLPFTPVSSNALNGDFSRFSCVVLPGGAGVSLSAKLREWMSGGGAVISLGRPNWALGSGNLVELAPIKGEPQSLPGSLFRAALDDRSFLSYGYAPTASGKTEIAVPIGGDSFYQTRKEGGSIVTMDPDEKVQKLLSGWEYNDDTEKNLAGTVWLQDVPVGRGHAILFFEDPTERAMWPGLEKILLNAMLMGPS
jgi:hypothetical protein